MKVLNIRRQPLCPEGKLNRIKCLARIKCNSKRSAHVGGDNSPPDRLKILTDDGMNSKPYQRGSALHSVDDASKATYTWLVLVVGNWIYLEKSSHLKRRTSGPQDES